MPQRAPSLHPFPFYEFFAGGGMSRLGLGPAWRCTFANDWCEKKAAAYRAYFGAAEYRVADVAKLKPADLPGAPVLAWASFPCQDLSLAGNGAGLAGQRSGTFHPFWKLMRALAREARAPRIIVLENVTGALTSHDGRDFTAIVRTVSRDGYRIGALVIDAVRFVPQSRPRLFFVAARQDLPIPSNLIAPAAAEPWHTNPLRRAFERLPRNLQKAWLWWNIPAPEARVPSLHDLLEPQPTGTDWHTRKQTSHILSLMSPLHRRKVGEARKLETSVIGAVYRRMRRNELGEKVQRAEVRFDEISGCLRTPAGGSSRQTVLQVEGRRVRSRLLSPREAARLMGVPDDYPLPENYNNAYHLLGDGVVVPVVRWLSDHLLKQLAAAG